MRERPEGSQRAQRLATRRRFLGVAFGAGAAAALYKMSGMSFADESTAGVTTEATTTATAAGGTLPVPELVEPTDDNGVAVYAIEATTGTDTSLVSGTTLETAGYNGTFLGPTILVNDGDRVRFEVTNGLAEETTVHWHGLHIAPSNDGGPQNVIAAGETWAPETTINQGEACTLWYHPHGLGNTADQVALGLAGLLIVDDGSESNAALPTTYGADDIPLILQSVGVLSSGAFVTTNAGFTSSGTTLKMLVNGFSATDETPTLEVAYRRVRLRLLNASLVDSITVARSDGAVLTQVASDAGLLAAPITVSSLRLTPGERAEVVLDLDAGSTVTLQGTARSSTNGSRYTVPIVEITSAGTDAPAELPASLNTIADLDTTGATARTLTFANSGNTFTINGVAGTSMSTMEANMIMTTLDATEVWTLVNASTTIYHNFHVHDVPFQVVSIGGAAPTGANLGWRDTIELPPGTTVVIKLKFTDYTDSTYMYMLHCHNLIHEDDGMMLGLMVV